MERSSRSVHVWLVVVILAGGFQAIVTQSLLLREALVLMLGSELAWGLVLFAWLLGVGLGALIGGWMSHRVRRADVVLAAVLVALGVVCCLELWSFRSARIWLGVLPGELVPLVEAALIAVAFVMPAGALVGTAFPLACCVRLSNRGRNASPSDAPLDARSRDAGYLQVGSVYAVESAGSLVGGAAFTFWAVDHLSPIQTALICCSMTAVASAGLLFARRRPPPFGSGSVVFAGLALTTLVTCIFAGDRLDHQLSERRWTGLAPGYERVAETESKMQHLAIGRRGGQYSLYSDGQVAADFPDPYTHVPPAHFWMCQHPSPRNVLLIGGGAEGLLAEILRHPVTHVDYVEPDPRQIELMRPFLTEQDRAALDDSRVTVHHEDARFFLKRQRDRFDLVIARAPEPTSASRARFYTDDYFQELHRAMTHDGVLCMTAGAAPGGLSPLHAEYLASIRAVLLRHFPDVVIGWGNPAQVLAATRLGLTTTSPSELRRRYAERGVVSEHFDPLWFDGATDWLDPQKLDQRSLELDRVADVPISTDLHPVVYVQYLAIWEAATHATRSRGPDERHRTRSSGVIERLRSIGWLEIVSAVIAVAGVVFAASFAVHRRRRDDGSAQGAAKSSWLSACALTLSIGSTGLATMALSIVLLFAFQNLYGYIYQRIGWIVALFMTGLVLGCGWISWRCRRNADRSGQRGRLWVELIAVDLAIAVLAVAVPFVLRLLGSAQHGLASPAVVEGVISALVVMTGVLGGGAFALAGGLRLGHRHALEVDSAEARGRAAGWVVGADHIGACLGALGSGLVLVPVLGIPATAYLLAGLKLASGANLLLTRRPSCNA